MEDTFQITSSQVEYLVRYDRWVSRFFMSVMEKPYLIVPKFLIKGGLYAWKNVLGMSADATRDAVIVEADRQMGNLTAKQIKMLSNRITEKCINQKAVKQNVEDAISRATSYLGWQTKPEIIQKMIEEIGEIYIDESWTPPKKQKKGKAPLSIKLGNPPNWKITISDATGKIIHAFATPQVTGSLFSIYPEMTPQELAEVSLLCRLQRSDGGSNWSPSKSYPKLSEQFNSGKVGILECFCGVLNNQDLIYGEKITHGRLALDWEFIRERTGDTQFRGSWPDDVIPQIERLSKKFSLIRLLVNPPYSEPEIWRVRNVLSIISSKYRDTPISIRVSMTLPSWDDLYLPDGPIYQIPGVKILSKRTITGDIVFNMSKQDEHFRTKLVYVQLELELACEQDILSKCH